MGVLIFFLNSAAVSHKQNGLISKIAKVCFYTESTIFRLTCHNYLNLIFHRVLYLWTCDLPTFQFILYDSFPFS